jgi:Tfp pilus assembly protein PilE
MGQQQLLFIILGTIIIGIAVVVGINYFTSSSAKANREAVIADLTDIASMAQRYYRKSITLKGGGHTFTGWTVPANLSLTANMSAAVTATVAAQSVILAGVGTEKGNDGTTVVKVTMLVGPNAITSTTINN